MDANRCDKERPCWSKLYPELLGFITSKLGSMDISRFEAVCTSWNQTAKSCKSSPHYNVMHQTPLLMIHGSDDKDLDARRFFSIAENKNYSVENVFGDFGEGAWCMGSSHGWLAIMESNGNSNLFNPFSRDRIELPSIFTFNHVIKKLKGASYSYPLQPYNHEGKVVTSSDPSCNKDFVVVLMHNRYQSGKIAFCKQGDKAWIDLQDQCKHNYDDIIFHNGLLYTMTWSGSVEAWDMKKLFPTKTLNLWPLLESFTDRQHFSGLEFSSRNYLVESSNDLLFVERFRLDAVYHKGQATTPYRTLHFHIYKLSSDSKEWERVKYLHGRALFLGGNYSMVVSSQDFPECQENSIYFTDDNISDIAEKFIVNNFAGDDHGVYNLEEKVVKPLPCHRFFDKWTSTNNMMLLPFWVVPNPWPSTVHRSPSTMKRLGGRRPTRRQAQARKRRRMRRLHNRGAMQQGAK